MDTTYLTPKGYRRGTHGGRLRMEHDVVWEQHHGPIPAGHQIHHVNGDKADNDIGNLRLVNATEHKRIHSGCEVRDGVWWKPCGICGEYKPITLEHWYISPEGWPLYGRCRPCHIRKVVESRRLRRLRAAAS
jgi:hypothetical protein